MAGADYEILLLDPYDRIVDNLNDMLTAFDFYRIVNSVGVMTLTLPLRYYFVMGRAVKDWQIRVRRTVPGRTAYLDGDQTWYIRQAKRKPFGLELVAQDSISLLLRRYVQYAVGTAQTDKTGPADNVMKAVIRENFTAATDPLRNWSNFSVEADFGLAPSTSKTFARQQVLSVLQDLAVQSRQAGTYLAFDIVILPDGSRQFKTFVGQRGVDHRAGTNQPVILRASSGLFSDYSVDEDYTQEETIVYAGGQGELVNRYYTSSADPTRETTPFGRFEGYFDARNSTTPATVQAEADGELRNMRYKRTLNAQLQDGQQIVFGKDFSFGDQVTVVAFEETFDVRSDAYKVTLSGATEKLELKLTSVI